MKRTFCVFIIGLMISLTAFSQNVVYDKTNLDGIRTVVCSGVNLGVMRNMDVYIALVGFQYKSTVRYALAVSLGSAFKTEITNSSFCTITLDNSKDYSFKVVSGGTGILQSVGVDMDDVYKSYKRFAYYSIKKKYLKKFSDNAITQFEIEVLPIDYSVGFNDNKLGDNLSAAYANLNNLFDN